MAIPSNHRLDELLAISIIMSLARKIAKVVRQARTDSHSKGKRQHHAINHNETVPEIGLRRNFAAESDCAPHAWQAR
jgi:hypothetical protein